MNWIHESFDDNEFKLIKEAKGKLTWRQFILGCAKKGDNNGSNS